MATVLRDRATGWPEHVICSTDPEALAAILLPHVNLAIWDRAPMPPVPDAETLAEIDDITLTAEAARALPTVAEAMADAGYPEAMIGPLASDIAAHAERLSELLDRDTVAIRLEIVETDACRRFHSDYVTARLILTYSGPGTQWLDNADAARLREGVAAEALNPRALAPGQIALFKGREWSATSAIVHRSPPIAGTGQRRLVLVIDPAPDAPVPHA